MKKIITLALTLALMATMAVSAFADTSTTVDGTEGNDGTSVDQNYSLKGVGSGKDGEITEDDCVDFTKVKIEWTVSNIAVTYKAGKVWDEEALKWVDSKENYEATSGTASFDITNYSTVSVTASAKFDVNQDYSAMLDKAEFTGNDVTVSTPVSKTDFTTVYKDSDFTALKKTITATVSVKADEFDELADTVSASKFGAYTISIAVAKAN